MTRVQPVMVPVQSDGERIAVLENEMKNMTQAMMTLAEEVKDGFKHMDTNFVRRSDFDDFKEATEREFIKLEQRKALHNFLLPTLSAVAGSVLTFLVIEYLNRR